MKSSPPSMSAWFFRAPSSLSQLRSEDENDASSLSSTHSVGASQKNGPLPTPVCGPAGRRVSFNESRNEEYGNTLYAKEDCLSYWFTYDEHRQSKYKHRAAARAIQEAESTTAGGSHVDPSNDSSYTGILEDVYNGCYDPTTQGPTVVQQQKLQRLFVATQGDRLGLERRAVRNISRDKSRVRSELSCIIFAVQAMAQHGGSSLESYDEVADELRSQCEAMTKGSQLFAHHIAKAQYEADL